MTSTTSYTQEDYHRDLRLVRAVQSASAPLHHLHPDTQTQILREYGYKGLRTGKGKFTPLVQCEKTRVYQVLRELHARAIKRTDTFHETHRFKLDDDLTDYVDDETEPSLPFFPGGLPKHIDIREDCEYKDYWLDPGIH